MNLSFQGIVQRKREKASGRDYKCKIKEASMLDIF
jgi:hypothetical protein